MIPFSIYALIAVALSFVVGFFVGKRTNQQNAQRFVDSDVTREAGEKGRRMVQERIERRKARIMEHAKKEGRITNNYVENLFCISDSTARNYLNELEQSGELIQHGKSGRGVFYTPTNQ